MILAYLKKRLSKKNIIINEQFGFRSNHSTVQQILRITKHIANEYNKNGKGLWFSVAQRYKLNSVNTPTCIQKIIQSYLNDRMLVVSVNAMILFSLYINGIPKASTSLT